MQSRGEPGRELRRLWAAQSDVVTREQALGLGLSRHTLGRLIAEQHWQRLAPGVFLTHGGDVPWPSLAWAGALVGGTGSRLGGQAAAFAGRLIDDEPRQILVLVPHGTKVRTGPHWTFVQERPGARSPRTTGSPPRTLPAETVLDLCEGATARVLEDLVTRAVQKRLTTPDHLLRALDRRSRHSRRTLLRELLAEVAEGVDSPLELRYLRDVERRHGLPDGKRQRSSRDGRYRRDVLYLQYGVVVELDGRKGHIGEAAFRDMRRDNAALRDRLAPLRYGFGDVAGQPCVVAWEVANMLTRGGWTGELQVCDRCPRRPEYF